MSTNEEEVGEILEYDELEEEEDDDEEIDELLQLSPSSADMTEQYHKLLTRNHKVLIMSFVCNFVLCFFNYFF